ncbi:MAG: SH3 domain-containing protein, partial [Lachnospiraceae bacterium]|nr:SH3 domain-containing protein [Lachnospiraceae bacterium]
EIKKFLAEHYQYVAVAALFLILVIVLIIFSVQRNKNGSIAATEVKETEVVSTEPIPVPEDVDLKQNAFEEINSFFTGYFRALAAGDFDTLSSLGETLSDDDKAKKTVRASYTEDYENMSCYTVDGPEENTYIVFVYYEIKFKNIDTLAPGLSTFYLVKDGSSYRLKSIASLPDNEKDYITNIAGGNEVQSLLEAVDTLYQKNTESDPTLAAFMTSLQTKIDATDATTIAEMEADATESAEVAKVRVTTTDTVNVRSTPSESGEKVGTAMKGDSFIRISEENGWSKIEYRDTEAYVKSDFLTTAQGDTVVAGQVNGESVTPSTEETTAPAETEKEKEKEKEKDKDKDKEKDKDKKESSDNSSKSSVSGKTAVVSEPISVRGEASTDAAKIGSAYKGGRYKIYGEENGWYKIDYNGVTGYVRADLVSVE